MYSAESYADHCLFEVDFYERYGTPKGGYNTIIAKTLSNPHVTGGSHTNNGGFNDNSFVVVASPGVGYDESIYTTNGVSCVVSNANLTADFVAADASCPSVRSGDLPDYGYRNSGFRHEADPTVPEWAKAENKPSYTAAEVGALSTNGGTLNGGITVWGDSTFYCNTFSFSDTFKIKFMDAVMTPYLEIFGNDIYLPLQSGTLALTSDIPTSMAWGAITSKPTTLSGYGITDALSSGGVSNIVTQAFVRDRLGVYLYVGEDGGIYVHTGD